MATLVSSITQLWRSLYSKKHHVMYTPLVPQEQVISFTLAKEFKKRRIIPDALWFYSATGKTIRIGSNITDLQEKNIYLVRGYAAYSFNELYPLLMKLLNEKIPYGKNDSMKLKMPTSVEEMGELILSLYDTKNG